MKKIYIIGILLCIIGFVFFTKKPKESQSSYTVKTQNMTFEIEEIYQPKTKDHEAQYVLQIDKMFPIQINIQKQKKHLIEEVYYFENEYYQCIYVKGEKLPTLDVLCYQNDIIYPYQTIVGKDSEVDEFVDALEISKETWIDKETVAANKNGMILYDNFVPNHIIGFENYKGVTLLDDKNTFQEKKLFTSDKYQKTIEIFVGNFYLVADYNEPYEFHEFYLINLLTGKESKLISNEAISMDSYIQGVVDGKIYLLDCNYKKQYQIDWRKKTVKKIGDTDKGVQMYQAGEFKTVTMYEALKEKKLFQATVWLEESVQEKYDTCESNLEYTYCYLKTNSGYQVYRYHKQMPQVGYYLTTVNENFQSVLQNDYFYWKESDTIYYYHDLTGIRKVFTNPEFAFNEQLRFGVYKK